MTDRAASIFGNEIDARTYKKACKAKRKHAKSSVATARGHATCS